MLTNPPTHPLADRYYSLPADLELIPLGAEEWLCASPTRSSRLGGPLARLVVEQILPLLQSGSWGPDLTEQLPAVDPAALHRALEALLAADLLRCTPAPPPPIPPDLAPFLALLEALHLPAATALARLSQAQITIFGLEGAGADLAILLARCGLGHLQLVDPYPCQPGDLPLLPVGSVDPRGRPRQEVVAQALQALRPPSRPLALTLGPAALTPQSVADLVVGSTCVFSGFDRGFAAVHHWINRASLAAGVPALYAAAAGVQGWAGPLVLPGQTACYLCYCMRRCACAPDPAAALAYEEHLDRQQQPPLLTRPQLPGLLLQLAGQLAPSLWQVILGLDQPALAGRVLEYQALTLATTVHRVLAQPNCPACGGRPAPLHSDLPTLLAAGGPAADLLGLTPDLVSPQTGLIRAVRWYDKDPAEPALPHIYQVTLANHQFQAGAGPAELSCWGKGLTSAEAQASGLGEALERYGGEWVPPAAIMPARR
ncbi:MAG TPA: TOMM precursor leader peptide-binding protein, partial [Chloroflexia bacterium]|nr:TOMM precursor leader peptide-binding protein [Chloroflexia bacterium]